MMCAQTGIDNTDTVANSAGYVASWLTALSDDHRLVITAAAQAQRASDLIYQAERQLTPDSGRHPRAAPSGDEHPGVSGLAAPKATSATAWPSAPRAALAGAR